MVSSFCIWIAVSVLPYCPALFTIFALQLHSSSHKELLFTCPLILGLAIRLALAKGMLPNVTKQRLVQLGLLFSPVIIVKN